MFFYLIRCRKCFSIAVQGEDDCQEVTVGSVVTLKVKLIRSRLLDPDKRMEEIREINEKVYM